MSEKRPDKCANCTNPCTIHLSQVIDGKLTKISVCESCPSAKQALESNSTDIMSLVGKKPVKPAISTPSSPLVRGKGCPKCGFTREDFKEKGRLGCSHCYDTFAEGLSKVLGKVQKGMIHKGKGSASYVKADPEKEVAELKEKLEAMVLVEKYEEAAKLRDRIREIESI